MSMHIFSHKTYEHMSVHLTMHASSTHMGGDVPVRACKYVLCVRAPVCVLGGVGGWSASEMHTHHKYRQVASIIDVQNIYLIIHSSMWEFPQKSKLWMEHWRTGYSKNQFTRNMLKEKREEIKCKENSVRQWDSSWGALCLSYGQIVANLSISYLKLVSTLRGLLHFLLKDMIWCYICCEQ